MHPFMQALLKIHQRNVEATKQLAEIVADTKKCTKCKKEQPLSQFSKNKMSKDGIHYQCKACMRAVRETRKQYVSGLRRR